jgi:polysaccharide chain length determinant protein (PEP-CTERM system associated)
VQGNENEDEQKRDARRREVGMTQRELTPADYIAMFRRRWVLIVIFAVIGPPLAYGVSLALPSEYVSQTLVLVQQPTVPSDIVKPVDTTDISQRLSSMQQQILSRSRLEPIIRQFGLYPKDVNRLSIDELVARLQKAIEVTPVQPMAETKAVNLPGFFVNVKLDNARNAQQVCTAITSMFIEQSLSVRQEHSEDTTQFLTQQLAEAKTQLDAQDKALAAFKMRYGGSLPDEEPTNLNLLTGLTSQLDAATQALARAQQDKSFAETVLTQQVAAWQASQSGRDPDTLDQQLAALQTQLAGLEARYTEDYPDVIKTKADITALQKKIAENDNQSITAGSGKPQRPVVEPGQITQLRAQVHSFEQVIAEKSKEQEQIKQQIKLYQDRVQSSPVVEEQYKELTRGYQTALDSFSDLQKKVGQSQMATDLEHQQEGEQFRVLDPANLPDKPTFPNRPLFAGGGLAGGLGLGLGLAFLMEMRDTSMRTERDVEFVLRLPVLAMVPEVGPLTTRVAKKTAVQLDTKSSLGLGAGA